MPATSPIRFVDVEFVGARGVIASAVLEGPEGIAVVDPGPTTSLAALQRGLRAFGYEASDIRALLLTHIHLDHAGASGTLVREHPGMRVYVHERGARHMARPERLLESATRLYGEAGMAYLWGDFLPVPEDALHPLAGGEQIEVCGHTLDVAYTPGHASHHVSYLDRQTGTAFVGDVAGGRLGQSTFVMTPTPPPDIDLASWQASLDLLRAWNPASLFLTHFGPSPLAPADHLQQLSERLPVIAEFARDAMARGESDEARLDLFQTHLRAELRRHMPESEAVAYELAMPLDHCFLGLQRYWQKRG